MTSRAVVFGALVLAAVAILWIAWLPEAPVPRLPAAAAPAPVSQQRAATTDPELDADICINWRKAKPGTRSVAMMGLVQSLGSERFNQRCLRLQVDRFVRDINRACTGSSSLSKRQYAATVIESARDLCP